MVGRWTIERWRIWRRQAVGEVVLQDDARALGDREAVHPEVVVGARARRAADHGPGLGGALVRVERRELAGSLVAGAAWSSFTEPVVGPLTTGVSLVPVMVIVTSWVAGAERIGDGDVVVERQRLPGARNCAAPLASAKFHCNWPWPSPVEDRPG